MGFGGQGPRRHAHDPPIVRHIHRHTGAGGDGAAGADSVFRQHHGIRAHEGGVPHGHAAVKLAAGTQVAVVPHYRVVAHIGEVRHHAVLPQAHLRPHHRLVPEDAARADFGEGVDHRRRKHQGLQRQAQAFGEFAVLPARPWVGDGHHHLRARAHPVCEDGAGAQAFHAVGLGQVGHGMDIIHVAKNVVALVEGRIQQARETAAADEDE